MNPDFGFPYLSWSQSHWVSLALAVTTLTLALIVRLAHGRLGLLAVPVWLVSLPSALHSYFILSGAHHEIPDASAPWMLLIAPFIAFGCCSWAPGRPRFWGEDVLAGTMLANLSIAMWCAMEEALSV